MQNENYYVIQGWMLNKLGLKGNELLVYAVIYGFSQDDGSLFSGSQSYLASCCGCSVRSIQTVLNTLVAKHYLTKYESEHNGVKSCSYVANFGGTENFSGGTEKIAVNNKVNNNSNNLLSKDNKLSEQEYDDVFQFGVTKQSKPNLYQKCMMLIDEWTNIQGIHDLLKQYLDLCMEMKSIRGANQWKGMLNTLEKVQKQCHPHTYEEIIQMSIQHGWKTFYPINDNHKGISGKRFDDLIRTDESYSDVSHIQSDKEF